MRTISNGTRVLLGNVIRTIADQERDTEVMRELLAQLKNFEPYTAFTRLDRLKLGHLVPKSFDLFLRLLLY